MPWLNFLSVSQCWGSGSGTGSRSAGSARFQAWGIRIQYIYIYIYIIVRGTVPDPDDDVTVGKLWEKIWNFYFGIFKINEEMESDPDSDSELDPDPEPDSDPLVRGTDPEIRIRIRTKMSWIPNTGVSLCCLSTCVIRNGICSAFQLEFLIVLYIEYIELLPTSV